MPYGWMFTGLFFLAMAVYNASQEIWVSAIIGLICAGISFVKLFFTFYSIEFEENSEEYITGIEAETSNDSEDSSIDAEFSFRIVLEREEEDSDDA